MRPQPIILFERFYLTGIVLGALSDALSWRSALASVAAQGAPVDATTLLGTAVARVLIDATLWYFVAYRSSRVAKWILAIWVALQFTLLVVGIARGAFTGGLIGMLTLLAVVLKLAGVIQTFRPDARPWFAGRKAA